MARRRQREKGRNKDGRARVMRDRRSNGLRNVQAERQGRNDEPVQTTHIPYT